MGFDPILMGKINELSKRMNDLPGEYPTGGDTLTINAQEWLSQFSESNLPPMIGNGDYYKISDATPSRGDLANGAILVLDDERMVYQPEGLFDCGTVAILGLIAIAYDATPVTIDGEVLNVDEPGLYVNSFWLAFAVCSVTIPGYTGFPSTKKLDSKYLPDALDVSEYEEEVFPETEITGTDMDGSMGYQFPSPPIDGSDEYIVVTFDGTEYKCILNAIEDSGLFYGNLKFLGEEPSAAGEPFMIMAVPGYCIMALEDANAHTVSISVPRHKKIAAEYVDGHTNFYISALEDSHVYIDANLTTKATAEEFENAFFKGPIRFLTAINGICDGEYFPNIIELDSINGAAHVVFYDWDSNNKVINIRGCYTAEYTPSE